LDGRGNNVNARTSIGTKAGDQDYEQSVELNYGLQLAPWFLVRPGLQYVMQTGAFKETAVSQNWKDAWVYETQVKFTF